MAFLAFEGLDGSGKSTLIQGLKAEFTHRGIGCVVSREPGGTVLGDEIRQLLLRVSGEAPVARAEALLYQAGRAQHVEQLIKPALAAKKWVLCDRFAASSVAFQGGGREISEAGITWLNDFSTGGLQPDLYVLLDVSVDESMRRLKARQADADRLELEAEAFHQKVRQTYLRLAQQDPAQWLVLSAALPPADLLEKLIEVLRVKKWLD